MAEPGPVAPPEAVRLGRESPEVKSKLSARKKVVTKSTEVQDQDAHSASDRKFDRQPVFLIMASGQIESAEVTRLDLLLCYDHQDHGVRIIWGCISIKEWEGVWCRCQSGGI